jgi:hypothetical protein
MRLLYLEMKVYGSLKSGVMYGYEGAYFLLFDKGRGVPLAEVFVFQTDEVLRHRACRVRLRRSYS